jgi:hypothetical protein
MNAMTFILGDRVYDVRLSGDGAARAAALTVTVDSRYEWSTTVAAWQTVSFGACGDVGYVWSARELVELPTSTDSGLTVINVDEDLLAVFRVENGRLAVRETSVRRIVDGVETARDELGEVVDVARWEGKVLLVRDAADVEHAWRVDGDRLLRAG